LSKFTILIEEYGIGHAIAALEKGRLIDFLVDPIDEEQASMIGSIVTAKHNNPVKGINGSFVTLPQAKKGFLKGNHKLPPHSIVPVYIGTNTERHKAQPVTTKLILKGRYIILTPGSPGINISRVIKSEIMRKNILDGLLELQKDLPLECGIIVRSRAEGTDITILIQEVREKLFQFREVLNDDLSEPRVLVSPFKARELAMLEWSFSEPHVVIEEVACFDQFGVWEQISELRLSRVTLENGGFLMIESTSALVAVDINTGSDVTYAGALKTNLLAVKELPRQLNIRGLGGKIVLEFAPLSKKDRPKIEIELKKALDKTRTECIVVGWTKLGNLELQKKRDKQPIIEILKKDY
jgi:Ribonuclease G/E